MNNWSEGYLIIKLSSFSPSYDIKKKKPIILYFMPFIQHNEWLLFDNLDYNSTTTICTYNVYMTTIRT